MKESIKALSRKRAAKVSTVPFELVRDPKTGGYVTVKGVGALKDSDFKIDESVDLLKPIAEQVFGERSQKRKTG